VEHYQSAIPNLGFASSWRNEHLGATNKPKELHLHVFVEEWQALGNALQTLFDQILQQYYLLHQPQL
jgi:hypothetical protein